VGQFINPLNAKWNPICHLLALLGVHLILHISRVRVNYFWKVINVPGPQNRALQKTTLNSFPPWTVRVFCYKFQVNSLFPVIQEVNYSMVPLWFNVSHSVAEPWLLICDTNLGDVTRDKAEQEGSRFLGQNQFWL
jgi:hypothetical protein